MYSEGWYYVTQCPTLSLLSLFWQSDRERGREREGERERGEGEKKGESQSKRERLKMNFCGRMHTILCHGALGVQLLLMISSPPPPPPLLFKFKQTESSYIIS